MTMVKWKCRDCELEGVFPDWLYLSQEACESTGEPYDRQFYCRGCWDKRELAKRITISESERVMFDWSNPDAI